MIKIAGPIATGLLGVVLLTGCGDEGVQNPCGENLQQITRFTIESPAVNFPYPTLRWTGVGKPIPLVPDLNVGQVDQPEGQLTTTHNPPYWAANYDRMSPGT